MKKANLDLTGILKKLKNYKSDFAKDWAAFAKAEAEMPDPLQAKAVTKKTKKNPKI